MQQVLERGLDVLGGMEALERLSEGSDDQVDKKLELFLVAFKKGCRLPPVLVEELEKPAKVRSHSKEGCNEESNCRRPRGRESRQTDETRGKGKGKGNGGKGEHGSKGGLGGKGEREEDERVQVAPNMEAGGSHPQAMTDPG